MSRTYRIKNIVDECAGIKSFFFDCPGLKKARAGQFVMVWVPGMEEKPISVSYEDGITVKAAGPTTKALMEKRVGDWIGIRGPYGNGFDVKGKRPVMVAGGCGIASMARLTEQVEGKYTIIMGARTARELMFEKRFRGHKIIVCTDDGSKGVKAFPHEILEKLEGYDQIIACGPEPMVEAVLKVAGGRVPTQVSLERYMKCGCGLCGSCSIDPAGLRVCREGPVFWAEQLEGSEVGRYKRDKSGSKEWC